MVLNSNSGFRSGATSLAVKTANVSCPQDQSTNSTVPTYSVYENSTKSYEACEKLQLSVPWSTTIQLLTLHTLLISVDILTRFVRLYSFFFSPLFFLNLLSLSLFQWRLITLSVKWIRFFILRTSSTSSAEIGKRDGRSFTRVDTFPRLPLLFFLPSSRASIPRMRNYDLIKQEIFRTNDLRLVT